MSSMRHLDQRAHRPLGACILHVELLEDRLLLSGTAQAHTGFGVDVANASAPVTSMTVSQDVVLAAPGD